MPSMTPTGGLRFVKKDGRLLLQQEFHSSATGRFWQDVPVADLAVVGAETPEDPAARAEKFAALREEYIRRCHAMQAGVAMKMNFDARDTTPKHLRVGINTAFSDSSALVRLLISKGVITELEHLEALIDGMNREVAMYEDTISKQTGGTKITLV